MRKIQKRTDTLSQDPIIDIISGNTESERAKELTGSVSNIYELWALAKMAEHARREPIIDYLASAGREPKRTGPGKYKFSYDGYEVNYTRLKGTIYSVCLSIPGIIDAKTIDDDTLQKSIEYVKNLSNMDIYVEDGYVSVAYRMAPPSEHNIAEILKARMRRLIGTASLIRRLLSYDVNN